MALGKFKRALKDFEAVSVIKRICYNSAIPFQIVIMNHFLQVMKARPNDKDAKAKYQQCNKIVKMDAFQRAIAVEAKQADIAQEIEATLDAMSKLWLLSY